MTPFEQGYKAFLDGKQKEENEFDAEKCPNSHGRWIDGWTQARRDRK